MVMSERRMQKNHEYDINGVFRTHLDQGFPFLEAKWLGWKTKLSGPALNIRRGEVSNDMISLNQDTFFREGAYQIAIGNDLFEVDRGSITCSGPVIESDLEHNVIVPVMNRMIPKKGVYLARASAVSVSNQLHAFFGISGSGKTSVLLEHLIRGMGYMGDGKIFIDRYGHCTTYSPLICFHERNLALFPELFSRLFADEKEQSRNERDISFRRLGQSLNGSNFFTKIAKNSFLKGPDFNYFAPHDRVFPHSQTITKGPIARAFLLQRGGGKVSVNRITPDEAASYVAASEWIQAKSGGYCHNALAELAGLDFCDRADYQNILNDFFVKADCYRVRIPPNATRETIKTVVDTIHEPLSDNDKR
jgi:hypothetical protein